MKLRYHIVYTLSNSLVKTEQFKVQIIHLLACVWLAAFYRLFPLNILFWFLVVKSRWEQKTCRICHWW